MIWSLSTFHDYERKGGRPCVDNLGPFVMCDPEVEATSLIATQISRPGRETLAELPKISFGPNWDKAWCSSAQTKSACCT